MNYQDKYTKYKTKYLELKNIKNQIGGSKNNYTMNHINETIEIMLDDGFIDCGKNEELFLAIAALRDDSDRLQWFVHQDGSFLKCECDSKIDMWGDFEYPEIYPRKATVEELIEHFNK